MNELYGHVQDWDLGVPQGRRRYIDTVMPYADARQFLRTYLFQPGAEEGEQRSLVMGHVRKLRNAMVDGHYTPTQLGVALRQRQRDKVVVNRNKVTIPLDEQDPLPVIDGGHRLAALDTIWEESEKTPTRKLLEKLPVSIRVYIDGNARRDFVNLQAGRSVHVSHVLTMKIAEGLLNKAQAEPYGFAMDVARLLNEDVNSPLYHQVRFATGSGALPFSSVASKSASDLSTSLFGAAKLAIENKKSPQWLAEKVTQAYTLVKRLVPDALKEGYLLCPPPDGNKGGAGLLVGVGMMWAFRELAVERQLDTQDEELFRLCVDEVFNERVNGNLSGPGKRKLMADFVGGFFNDLMEGDDAKFGEYYNIPVPLVKLLGSSTFCVPKLPRPQKKRGRKTVETESQESEPVDTEETEEQEPVETDVFEEDGQLEDTDLFDDEVDKSDEVLSL